MIRSFWSLRFRLILLVLLALVPALALVLYSASEQRRLATAWAEQDALQFARQIARSDEELVASTRQLLSVLAQHPSVRNAEPDVCGAFLAQVLSQYPRYTNFGVIARNGDNLCRATPAKSAEVEPPPFLQRVLDTRDFAASDFMVGKTTGKAILIFAYPLFDQSGAVESVVYAALDLVALNRLASDALLSPGSTLMVNDRNGTILARYPEPEKWVGRLLPDASIIKTILNRQGEGTANTIGVDGVQRLYAFTPLNSVPNNKIYVSVGIPTVVAFEQVNQSLTRNLLALGLVAVLALAAAWIGGDWFLLRQVQTLVSLTGRLAKGDLAARAGSYSVGELGQLAQAFDRMGESLQQHEAARQQAEEQIRRWSAELEQLMNAISEAISQSQEVSEIAEIALTRTLSMMGLCSGGVFLKRGETLAVVAQIGLGDEIAQSIQRTQTCAPARDEREGLSRSGTVAVIPTETAGPMPATGRAEESWIRVPIKSRGRVLGLMCLACDPQRLLKAHEEGVLAAVGQQIGVAIENAKLNEQVQSIAALQERERLSRELHDGLAQVLGYLCIRTDIARGLLKSGQVDRAAEEVQEMQNAAQQAHQDLRESILGLRATIHPQGGLFSILKEYLHNFSVQSGIAVHLVASGNGSVGFSPEAEVQLLRIIQEALANIRKHSNAKQAWVRFEPNSEFTRVTIEDDGRGFNPAMVRQDSQSRFGLQTMRERAEDVGGSLHIASQPGQGSRISIDLPIRPGGK